MKTLTKILSIFIGGGMIMVVFAFILHKPSQEDKQDQGATSFPFPELLVRNEALKQTAEWQSNVNRVSALSSRLIENPNDAEAITDLAQVYCVEARVTGEHGYYFPAILKMLDRALSIQDIPEKVRFNATALKANVLLSQHRFAEGREVAEMAHKMNPYSPQVYAALIDANVELGEYARAVELTDEMMDFKPGLMAYSRASYLRELYGDLDGAIEAMEMAVEAGYPGYENTEWTRVTLGHLYLRNGDIDKAEMVFRKSLEVREENPFAKAGLAKALVARGENSEAEGLLKSALNAVPEIAFEEELMKIYSATGRKSEADASYGKVIEMVTDDEAHGHIVDLDYAKILLDLGNDPDAALARVLIEQQRRPDNLEVNLLLARIYAIQGNKELARDYLAKATRTGYTNTQVEELKYTLG